jgi:hypothetical protein
VRKCVLLKGTFEKLPSRVESKCRELCGRPRICWLGLREKIVGEIKRERERERRACGIKTINDDKNDE